MTHGLGLAAQLGAKVTIVTGTELWSVIEMTRHAHDRRNPIEAYEQMASEHATKVLSAAAAMAAAQGVPLRDRAHEGSQAVGSHRRGG